MTQRMYVNNAAFYKEVERVGYNIFYFARKMLRGRWTIVRFLSFGAKGGYLRSKILKTLDKEFPTWRTEFAWQVLVQDVEDML